VTGLVVSQRLVYGPFILKLFNKALSTAQVIQCQNETKR
jgi:hypothetical protein